MIYYNYPPYYYSQSNRYPNRTQSNNTYPKTLPSVTTNNMYPYKANYNKETNTRNYNHTTYNNIKSAPKEPPRKEEIEHNKPEDDKVLFEIFGIKLYFDDILLICLIFFLYNEGVQDQYLFIALILLLLS